MAVEESSGPGLQQYVIIVALSVLAWEVFKKALQAILGVPAAASDALLLPPQASANEFVDLPVPEEPHVEMALHPPQGLHHSNPKEQYHFESECTAGSYLFFHAPTGPSTAHGPDGFDYAEYFQGKSRLWEMRIHMNFKKPPPPEDPLFFGIELEDYVPMSRPTHHAQKVIVGGIRQAIGGLYHTAGDNPKLVAGEREQPVCVLPLWAFDQFIETPEGQEPPKLWDPDFERLGQKRYKRIAKYAEEITELQRRFRVGPTYTFAFWGNSRFLDVINWMVVGVPIVTPINFNKFAGKPPVHVVLYSLAPSSDPGDKKRHLSSRKTYYFRAAVWSSSWRPPRRRIEALIGASEGSDSPAKKPVLKKPKSVRRRLAGFVRRVEECTGRSRPSE